MAFTEEVKGGIGLVRRAEDGLQVLPDLLEQLLGPVVFTELFLIVPSSTRSLRTSIFSAYLELGACIVGTES
jgi:hypothetical protein